MDILFIEKLAVMAVIGVHDWEKKCFQKLVFDVKLAYDNKLFKHHQMFSYLDYTKVRQVIMNIVRKQHFLLIEDVAEMTAKILMKKFCVYWVCITVSKPNAMRDIANVGVCIKRKR